VWHWDTLSSKVLKFSLETAGRKMGLRIREVATKCSNMSLANVKTYLHSTIIDYSNVVAKLADTLR